MKTFFDLLITLGIFITLVPALILLWSVFKRPNSWEARNKKLSTVIASTLLFGTAILIWGSFIEPQIIITKHYQIDLPDIQKPIRIALIGDIQIGPYKQTKWTQKIVDKTLELKPDLVLFAGDQVDNMYYDEQEVYYLKPLSQLATQIPSYAIHGNHEYGIGGGKALTDPAYRVADMSVHTKKALEEMGIRYLVNELEKISIDDESFYLFGGDSYWAGKLNFDILQNRTENIPTLALVHNPSFIAEKYPDNVDLYLSGHTHGGQIRLPLIGPLGKVDSFLPTKYYKGLHTLDTGPQLLVTAGIGETGTRARLFNPPEIVLITLK